MQFPFFRQRDNVNKRAWQDTLSRFALRPAAWDAGRYARLEAFLKASGLIKTAKPASDFTVDINAQ